MSRPNGCGGPVRKRFTRRGTRLARRKDVVLKFANEIARRIVLTGYDRIPGARTICCVSAAYTLCVFPDDLNNRRQHSKDWSGPADTHMRAERFSHNEGRFNDKICSVLS